MSRSIPLPLAALASSLALASLALVEASPAAAQTKPGEIKGSDVMGDKSRSAQDGWEQAPVPREQSAAKDAPNPGGTSTKENRERPVPAASPSGSSATDPQAPLDQRTGGPSGMNPSAPSK